MGHLMPLLHLAHWAAQSGIKSTFIASDIPLQRAPKIMHENLHFVPLPTVGVTYEDYAKGPESVRPLYRQMVGPATAELERLAVEGATAVVASSFIFFAPAVAKLLGMHWTTLVDVSPVAAAVCLRIAAATEGRGPLERLGPENLGLPGYMDIGTQDIEANYGEKGLTTSGSTVWLARGFADLVKMSDAMLINAVPGLDPDFDDSKLGSRIGPLFRHTPGELPPDLANFLDRQAPRSVVYISFGTLYECDAQLAKEIADVLRKTGVPFIWITGAEVDPLWTGIISDWMPQAAVLQHPAIGLFYTHGGWNGTLEALSAGVPMLLRPTQGEQWLTARVLEEKYGCGRRGGPETIVDWTSGGWAKETEIAARLAEKVKVAEAESEANWAKWVAAAFPAA